MRKLNLDFLRVSAALMVLIVHLGQIIPSVSIYTNFGSLGVKLFFVLSGYLVMQSLERSHSLGEYALKRAIHILPIYFIVLILLYAAELFMGLVVYKQSFGELIGLQGACGPQWLRYFGCVHSMIPSTNYALWNNKFGLWTISSFVFFYVIAPVLQRVVRRFASSLIFLLALLTLKPWGGSMLEQLFAGFYSREEELTWVVNQTPWMTLPSFVFGICVYYALREEKETVFVFLSAAVLTVSGFDFYAPELLFSILILSAERFGPIVKKEFVAGLIQNAAKGSFSLYLVNSAGIKYTVILCGLIGVKNPWLQMLASAVGCILAAYLLARYIQLPIERKLRSAIEKRAGLQRVNS